MELLVEQLDRRVAEIGRWLEAEQGEPAEVRIVRETAPGALGRDYDDTRAPILAAGRRLARTGRHDRLAALSTPPSRRLAGGGHRARRRSASGPTRSNLASASAQELQRMQGMLYLDGQAYHGIDQYHRLIHLPAGSDYQFAANVWTGFADMEWQPNPVFRLVRMRPGRDPAPPRPARAGRRPRRRWSRITRRDRTSNAWPKTALLAIDWSCPGSDAFRQSLARAHQLVDEGLGAAAAPLTTNRRMIAAGHAHIDCAWLWPIAQTREKAGRTWSTALRLMERYPEYRFLASTPLQYEMVKESFPETFEGIRERVREGRWETVGGMWVEADCNLPDGESLARQMLVGTRYFEREFGVGHQRGLAARHVRLHLGAADASWPPPGCPISSPTS